MSALYLDVGVDNVSSFSEVSTEQRPVAAVGSNMYLEHAHIKNNKNRYLISNFDPAEFTYVISVKKSLQDYESLSFLYKKSLKKICN